MIGPKWASVHERLFALRYSVCTIMVLLNKCFSGCHLQVLVSYMDHPSLLIPEAQHLGSITPHFDGLLLLLYLLIL